MKRPVPHLPDPVIRLAPDVAHVIGDARKHLAGIGVNRVRTGAVQPRCLHQVAVDVELRLFDGAVADAHRP